MDDLTIRATDALARIQSLSKNSPSEQAQSPDFVDLLKGAIEQVNAIQHESGRLEDSVARGESMNIHQAIIAGEKAGLSFRLMMQVRNKLIEAYQEVLRIQV